MTFIPRKKCIHPGCMALCRVGRYCDYHQAARKRANRERAKLQQKAKRKAERAKAVENAVRLLKWHGYTVTKSTQPETFPS